MSSSKYLSASQLNDSVLGVFSKAPTSEKLDHLIRFLSTWNGSDKFFTIIQYTLKLIIPFLELRARLQYNANKRGSSESSASVALSKLYGIIGDSRMLWRFWGLLPIYQWLTSLERVPPPTRKLLTIERIQGWSMLFYYPLEHLYYLRANELMPESISLGVPFTKKLSVKLNTTKLALWSTRAWAAYVLLQLIHLREDARLLKLRERALAKVKGKSDKEAETETLELGKRRDALWNELIGNMGNLPLSIHWSLEKGLFRNDIWVSIFGLIAGIASFRSGWQATALPPIHSPDPSSPTEVSLEAPLNSSAKGKVVDNVPLSL